MKKLELKFLNEEEKVVTVSLDAPAEPADPVAINAAMDEIIAQDCFLSSGGGLVSKKQARIVERNVNDIQI
ncbi:MULTISPECIES: DUF2922 domain-containing protein [Salimicrobium]|uniref:DUF2922 domain-containing protein n=4 Tax=Salimicrobium TaxID=351195 RepID=K2G6C1_9BACI|nr:MULTISPECIES: DUF2922 domain-containing protein [Salimicrobium]AKG03437.1 hypothetical protein AAV35_000670 [Salimicrobium jeotgali]EKE30728.1 hypothetical protein MJ3_12200 [Salimicrobium jeotgali]MBM7697143.1 hypothetical protein [Salimicrobium jeotgali]PBB06904.1 DUF2922 domain-containing protein [Salimicrobium humidisoli]SDY28390.1 Protein of unknown function [Salimicrobium album]